MGYSVMLALRAAVNAARAGGAGANSWFKLGIAVVFLPPPKKRKIRKTPKFFHFVRWSGHQLCRAGSDHGDIR